MKLIVNVFLALALTIGAFAATLGSANAADPASPVAAPVAGAQNALITIRFNQKIVAYHDQLFYIVREAVKTKQGVIFDVVATSASGKSVYGQQVANDIARIGVSKSQITFRDQAGNVTNEEVRVFVR